MKEFGHYDIIVKRLNCSIWLKILIIKARLCNAKTLLSSSRIVTRIMKSKCRCIRRKRVSTCTRTSAIRELKTMEFSLIFQSQLKDTRKTRVDRFSGVSAFFRRVAGHASADRRDCASFSALATRENRTDSWRVWPRFFPSIQSPLIRLDGHCLHFFDSLLYD